jgi:hypothetical protein
MQWHRQYKVQNISLQSKGDFDTCSMLYNKTKVVEYIIYTVCLLFGFRAMAPLPKQKSEELAEQTQHNSTDTESGHQISGFSYVTDQSQVNGNKNIICRDQETAHFFVHNE